MPELPEVETVRRGLAPALAGAGLARVEARRPDLRFPLPEGFVQRLTGARIERLDRRAKYLLAALDRDETLVMHLGMSGRFEIGGGARRPAPRRLRLCAGGRPAPRARGVRDGGRRGRHLLRSPSLRLHGPRSPPTQLGRHPWFASLGPEPLGEAFSGRHLARAFAGRRQSLKTTDRRPAGRGGARQHLCLRSPVPRAPLATRARRGGRTGASSPG